MAGTRTIVPLAALTLAACVTDSGGGGAAERRVIFECDRGPEIVVVFAGDVARIESETGPPIVMQQRVSGSGFWYESGTHSIRGKGEEITYTIGRMAPMTCTAMRPTPR
jgi:membrane-bound inhibitor of C-type lysozyme